MSKSATIQPAATVLMLRDAAEGPEVFMVRRHERTSFMGGAYVFPGGRVDPADRDAADERWCDGTGQAAAQIPELPAIDAVAYHVAAIRELFEEAGVLLARNGAGRFVSLAGPAAADRFAEYRRDVHAGTRSMREIAEREGLRLALDALDAFAHWVTPPVDVRRFDTRFFVTRVPPEQAPVHDDAETVHSIWIAPRDAIARCEQRDIDLPVPTWTSLREIESFGSVDQAIAWARGRAIVRREPRVLDLDGQRMLLLPGDPQNPDPSVEGPPRETRFVLTGGRWRPQPPGT